MSSFANMGAKITAQWEFRLSLSFFAEQKQSAIPLSES